MLRDRLSVPSSRVKQSDCLWHKFLCQSLKANLSSKKKWHKTWTNLTDNANIRTIETYYFTYNLLILRNVPTFLDHPQGILHQTGIHRGAVKSLARLGRKQARKHVRDARDFNTIETRAVIKFFFPLQGKAPKEIHVILTETLASFLPGRAKDLSAPCIKHMRIIY